LEKEVEIIMRITQIIAGLIALTIMSSFIIYVSQIFFDIKKMTNLMTVIYILGAIALCILWTFTSNDSEGQRRKRTMLTGFLIMTVSYGSLYFIIPFLPIQ